MGGKPQKPKIQAYVDQRWFDEFELYRATHNLNQSKALEKLLAEFFGGASASTLPPEEVSATSNLVDALRSELAELRYELDHRLQLVESRLAAESAHASAILTDATTSTDESAIESVIGQAELALPLDESAVHLDGLANESATTQAESAILLDESAIESAKESVVGITESASESSVGQDESAGGSAVEDAIASSSDDVSEPTATSNTDTNPTHQREGITATALAKRLGFKAVSSVTRRPEGESEEEFKDWSRKLDPDKIAWEQVPGTGTSKKNPKQYRKVSAVSS